MDQRVLVGSGWFWGIPDLFLAGAGRITGWRQHLTRKDWDRCRQIHGMNNWLVDINPYEKYNEPTIC